MNLIGQLKLMWRQRRLARLQAEQGERFDLHGVSVLLPAAMASESVRIQAMRGRYERKEARAIRRFLKPGTPVIELGGSLGVISAVIRSAIGPQAPHVVLEANPKLIHICAANAINPVAPERTRVLNAALAYGCDTVLFRCTADTLGGAITTTDEADAVAVRTTTLAALAAELPVPPGHSFALVCDIEGAELDMMQHEETVWRRVCLVVIETHPSSYAVQGSSEASFMALAKARGLRVLQQQKRVLVLAGPAAS